ncbi:GNAT family N-acetyltransferase [bacterium]|nr:GNAT family N-acetyltransferase [bacterium]
MSHPDQLKNMTTLLTDWKNANFQNKGPKELSQRILSIMEETIQSNQEPPFPRKLWHDLLDITGKSGFLQSLPDRDLQYRWAEAVFNIIRISQFTLNDMFNQRVKNHPQRILFNEINGQESTTWTYEQIHRHILEIAAVFYSSVDQSPRVAILSENSVESACCDLACLMYDILNTPLNVYLDSEVLIDIFNRLNINIVVTDTCEKCKMLQDISGKCRQPFKIFVTDVMCRENENIHFIGKYCKKIHIKEANKILSNRKHRDLSQVATVMFTSGSTGKPKGVCFSIYNLVTKRFARAAALPEVGDNEIFLCYLPLYHTFGRFLELLGSIYWGGTYTFLGNPSAETLIAQFPEINPTGFISIPLRWSQLYEKCIEKIDPIPGDQLQEVAIRSVIGNRLRWGLSAAGYLDPKIFRFFQRHGIKICSGFGLTEATGGITMTPTDKYLDNSHGIPMPGAYIRLGRQNEMQVRGPYIARYLDDVGADGYIPYPGSPDSDYWLTTGDLFQVSSEGYYEIVDRIKDIYKNNKGQTIAPRKVEKKFIDVPGVKRAFLVGDSHPYNVLFIVPNLKDPVLQVSETPEQQREYFHQIVATANQDLAPYERIVNFTVLDRDFKIDKKELTPKGTFNRKIIVENFAGKIAELYRSNYIELKSRDIQIKIPRWFFRDLGILEDEIQLASKGLMNKRTGEILHISKQRDSNHIKIGNLEYVIKGKTIDLGVFSRQPRLWIGNPALVSFCPIKMGWDAPFDTISDHVFRPWNVETQPPSVNIRETARISDLFLLQLHRLISEMIFYHSEVALQSLHHLEKILKTANDRTADVIRHRLETLARHPDEQLRCLAYKILLLDEPQMDYSKAFPAFINSGLSFLNKETIEEIAFSLVEKRRLDALRQRLFNYRLQLEWPVDEATRKQFINIFQLLVSFVEYHPEFYNSVRAELASWTLHGSDPELAKAANKSFIKLFTDFEAALEENTSKYSKYDWNRRIEFDEALSPNEISRIKKVLIGSTFLKQSIMLAFDENDFDLYQVPEDGIWISRLQSSHYYLLYRMSVNTEEGKHFDLQLVLRETLQETQIKKSVHWLEAVAGYPFGPPVLPPLGCYRPELGARSMVYLNEITVWGKIRQFSSIHFTGGPFTKPETWRKLFVTALSVFYRGWHNSGNKIVPGSVSPTNVVVPELDFRESAKILSLVGWKEYKNTLSLIQPMLRNFYAKTIANFPRIRAELNVIWIFDACIEALGSEMAFQFLNQLKTDLMHETLHNYPQPEFMDLLSEYIENHRNKYYLTLPLINAIERYHNWKALNPMATQIACEQTVIEVYHLYRLDRFHEIARYVLYRHTYFSQADHEASKAFDDLINAMSVQQKKPAIQFLELSNFQSTLTDSDDRNIFSRMVFPQYQHRKELEVLKFGESESEHVIVHTTITDKYNNQYTIRPPVAPAEIGQLYRLFFNQNFPKEISEQDKHFVVLNAQERVIAGISYQLQENNVAEIQGIVVSSPLKERGLGTAILEDFCNRMASEDIHVIKAHFFLQPFYEKFGFRVDKSWGALVKFLTPEKIMDSAIENEIGG